MRRTRKNDVELRTMKNKGEQERTRKNNEKWIEERRIKNYG